MYMYTVVALMSAPKVDMNIIIAAVMTVVLVVLSLGLALPIIM